MPNTTPDKMKTLLITATAGDSSDPWVLILDDCYTLITAGLEVEVQDFKNRNRRSKGCTGQSDLSH